MGGLERRYRGNTLRGRMKSYPFARGIVCAYNIHFGCGGPPMKTVIFETRAAMRKFYRFLMRRLRRHQSNLCRKTWACVSSLYTLARIKHGDGSISMYEIVDRDYCGIALLVEGYLNQEVITHEAGHVGFAHATWSRMVSPWMLPGETHEELVCYPAGIWASELDKIITRDGLRRTGGDSYEARRAWVRPLENK